MPDASIVFIPYPPWIREKQACQLFSVGKLTLRRWRREGYVRVADSSGTGRNIVYNASDIDRVLTTLAGTKKPVPFRQWLGKP